MKLPVYSLRRRPQTIELVSQLVVTDKMSKIQGSRGLAIQIWPQFCLQVVGLGDASCEFKSSPPPAFGEGDGQMWDTGHEK